MERDLLTFMGTITSNIDRYKKLDPVTRSIMLTDKLHIALTCSTAAFICDKQERIRNTPSDMPDREARITQLEQEIQNIVKLRDIIEKELTVLDETLQSQTKTPLKNIEQKLDAVLLGPDYVQGKKIMDEARDDYNKLIN